MKGSLLPLSYAGNTRTISVSDQPLNRCGIILDMRGYFWNTVLAINSVLWFFGVAFLTYATGMLIFGGEWRQFLFALATFVALSLIELILAALAHD